MSADERSFVLVVGPGVGNNSVYFKPRIYFPAIWLKSLWHLSRQRPSIVLLCIISAGPFTWAPSLFSCVSL